MSATSSDSGGALLSYRYSFLSWVAAEPTYSFATNTGHFTTSPGNFGGGSRNRLGWRTVVFKAPTVTRLRMTPYAMLDGGTLRFGPSASDFFTDYSPVHQSRGAGASGETPVLRWRNVSRWRRSFENYGMSRRISRCAASSPKSYPQRAAVCADRSADLGGWLNAGRRS
jgi:hypothetical protein